MGWGDGRKFKREGTSVCLLVVSQGEVGNRLESQARPLFLIDLE